MTQRKDFANTQRMMLTLGIILITCNGAFAQSTTSSIITWGSNGNGQLGRLMPQSNLSPGAVADLGVGSGTKTVVAGSAHSLALKSDGTVLAWGSNTNGQLGDGTTVSKLTPVQVSGLGAGSGVVAIAAGASFSMALKSDGTVLAWGLNTNGQLGDGSTTQRITPVQVSGLGPGSGVVSVAAGLGSHSLALKSDGTVLSWGLNSSSQLGDGTTTQRLTPIQTSGLGPGSGVVAIVAGGSFSLALKMDGTTLAWGANSNGQLGDGTTTIRRTPVQVSTFAAGSGVIAVAAGLTHTLALKSDGTVWSWGFNGSGQLGDGTFNQKTTPGQVSHPSGTGFLTGGSGVAAGSIYSLALKSDGTVLAWGDNTSGDLGDGTLSLRVMPVQVSGLTAGSGVTKIAGSNSHSLALKTDGSLLAWGSNNVGQLGRGTFDGAPAPIQNLTGADAIATGVGGTHSLFHKSDGTVLASGFNIFGQLGDGTVTTRITPVQVAGLGTGSGVVAIAAGGSHSLALKGNGAVLAWGSNTNGQLGDGTTTQRTTPVPVTNLGSASGIIAIAAGNSFSLALALDGAVWAWGQNTNGQLGDGTVIQRNVPVRIASLGSGSGVIAIAAGNSHSLAVKSDGTIWVWGLNSNGQLGDGTTTQRNTPVQVLDVSSVGFLTRVTGAAAGGSHSLALMSDGTVLAWGLNASGQIGDGTLNQSNIPVQVSTLGARSGVLKLAGGASHSLALKSDGVVWVWGSNSNGQLGDGSLENRRTPVSSLVSGSVGIAGGSAHSLAFASPPPPRDSTAPVITPTLAGILGNNGWYRSDVTVTWSITDPESSIASSTGCSTTTLNTDTAGTTLTCTATNSAGLTGSASATIKIDKTEPFVSFTRTAANANGWNNTAVLVRFTATDSLSGIDGTPLIDRNITTEGQNQTAVATFTDLAGNIVTATVDRIHIDMTAPTVQFGAPNPAANAAGWNSSDVQISFTASDNLSGLASTSTPSPLVLTTEGSSVNGTVVVTDLAGNTATFASPTVKIDKTGPTVTFTRTAANANGWNNAAVLVHFSATDALSGLNGSAEIDRNVATEGQNQSVTVSFADWAGNTVSTTVSGINIDMTAPAVQFGLPNPAANAAGWNNSDVQISFTTSDSLSGVVSTSVPSPLVLTAEGMSVKGTVVVTDAAGNTATVASPGVKIDKTKPVASATASPLPSPTGWNNTDVTVTLTGTDSLSGISVCSTPLKLTTNGTNQSASGTCTDMAGNVSQPATVTGINIDKSAPTISGMPLAECMLWPVDGKLVQIASISATDGYTRVAPGSLSVSVTANEPVDASDILINGGVVQVRATRLGNGNGRVYTVVARAADVAGNIAQATGSCTVPHDMTRSPNK